MKERSSRFHEASGRLKPLEEAGVPSKSTEDLIFGNLSLQRTKDDLGNQRFTSTKVGYHESELHHGNLERTEHLKPAALIISPEGKKLLQRHPHLLSDLDTALTKISKPVASSRILPGEKIDLDNGTVLELLPTGVQAHSYHTKLAEDDLKIRVIKTSRHASPHVFDAIRQPCINEMLQVQHAKRDVGIELAGIGFEMPTYYAATSHVGILKFEPGHTLNREDLDDEMVQKMKQAQTILQRYVDQHTRDNDQLWANIKPDINLEGMLKNSNIVRRPDGSLVIVDPFFIQRP